MQTLSRAPAPAVVAGRPAYRPFRVRVVRVDRLTPTFRQITLGGDDLDEFGTDGLDQRVKLILPAVGQSLPDFDPPTAAESTWYTDWLAIPADERPAMRTYTVRRVRPASREVDIVLVEHEVPGGVQGPAGAWLRRVVPGDEIILVGPDVCSPERNAGLDWHPGGASSLLLVGDDTAAPAIVAILESLSARSDLTVQAFVEVPFPSDRLPADLADGTAINWLARGELPHGRLLLPTVTAWLDDHPGLIEGARVRAPQQLEDVDVDRELLWDSPDVEVPGSFYAWIAGEAAMVKTLRRELVTERCVDRRRVAFMGYWRLGQAERS